MGQDTDIRDTEFERVYAQVDLDAVLANVHQIEEKIGPGTKILAVIKADAYGHGAVPLGKCLESVESVYGFGVATAQEAFILKKAGIRKPILILGYSFPCDYKQMAADEIRPAVFRRDSLMQLSEAAACVGKNIRVHIKVDTGMGRIGVTPDEEGLEFVREAAGMPGIEIEGMFTHFARADEADPTDALRQFDRFMKFSDSAERLIGTIPIKHCANSAAVMGLPQTYLDMVRPGIILYGLFPSDQVARESLPLKPALSLHSHVVYVKNIRAGDSVSYGGTFTADSAMRIATVPVGYGDGYPRSLSGKGYVLIRGRRAPILGRVCMDQFMVDVTDIEGVHEDDPVTLIGRDGDETVTAEELGGLSGRFNYELMCDLGSRVPRVYVQNGQITQVRESYGSVLS